MPALSLFGFSIWDVIGLSGAVIYVTSYLLAALDRLPSQSWLFYALKLVAASLVLIGLNGDFNLASAVIQVFFVVVSLLGLGLHFGKAQQARACERSREALHLEGYGEHVEAETQGARPVPIRSEHRVRETA